MTRNEYIYFLKLLMCSDPYPECCGEDELVYFANRTAKEYGYPDWLEAYHEMEMEEEE